MIPLGNGPRSSDRRRPSCCRALITGGDSGIGRAVAIAFAKEGADVAFGYLSEEEDADETQRLVEAQGVRCVRRAGDLSSTQESEALVVAGVSELGGLDIVVNHAGTQYQQDSLEDVDDAGMLRVFAVNVFAPIRITRAVLPHLEPGSSIINTASVTALHGNPTLLDCSASKGAILSFTYALASSLVDRGIRVNAVAPGPVWTPLIPSTFDAGSVEEFGSSTPMRRPAQADEIAPSYVFLASERLSSYYSGQVLAPSEASRVSPDWLRLQRPCARVGNWTLPAVEVSCLLDRVRRTDAESSR